MTPGRAANTWNPQHTWQTIWARRREIIFPALVLGGLSLAYAAARPDSWKASQALLVRDEIGGNLGRQGRFDSVEAMKTAQETVVEVARNSAVVASALASIGPPPNHAAAQRWPTRGEVESVRREIAVAAPKGAEFGRTEVVYLTVVERTRGRAVALAGAVCDQLQRRLNDVRNAKAQSIVAELIRTTHVAQGDLDAATSQLELVERQVGSDLGELRILSETGAGESNLRSALTQIKNELRQMQSGRDAGLQRRQLLLQAADEPRRLVDAPSQLLESQPGLRKLKEGLVDAMLRTAQLRGKMSDDHPDVQAARSAEHEVRQQLQAELQGAVRALDADLLVGQAQLASLTGQLADVEGRLTRLATVRARYGNLVAQVRRCTETLAKAQKELADARAAQAAAQSASLLTRIDGPETGEHPQGPGRGTIVLGGATSGLLLGLGWVVLTMPGAAGRRRWSDYLRGGRRASDRAAASSAATISTIAPLPSDRRGADRRGAAPQDGVPAVR